MRSIVRTFAGLGAVVLATGVLVAQQNTTVPQPRAGALPAPATASPKPSRAVARPEGMSPKAANGFTVTVAADLRAPRMMVYAPNGDLFVSSPGANNITVLRDANNDGVFESQSVYAQGAPPAAARWRSASEPCWRPARRRTGSRGRSASRPRTRRSACSRRQRAGMHAAARLRCEGPRHARGAVRTRLP